MGVVDGLTTCRVNFNFNFNFLNLTTGDGEGYKFVASGIRTSDLLYRCIINKCTTSSFPSLIFI